jgi:hypothetical protein
MRVNVSPEAAAFIAARGGCVWVWAARPPMCCNGTPFGMKASTSPPKNAAGFTGISADGISAEGVDVRFRAPGGRRPDVLEVDLHGRRNPKVEAYWDGCLIML